jgi:hypothetical protein
VNEPNQPQNANSPQFRCQNSVERVCAHTFLREERPECLLEPAALAATRPTPLRCSPYAASVTSIPLRFA